jgi:hypothetical protein
MWNSLKSGVLPRWAIIKILLHKEALRYRYNWGLLVMVFGLLILSALVSASAKMNTLPGQSGPAVSRCYILHPPNSHWAEHLRLHPPPEGYAVDFRAYRNRQRQPRIPSQSMAIELAEPVAGTAESDVWRATYWYLENAPAGILPYRDWFAKETRQFLGAKPVFHEETQTTITDLDRTDQVSMIVTALVVFSAYLLSFNLFITSTGEEREKRMLLGLLLTPTTATEFISAKVVFYGAASVVVSVGIVAMYRPLAVINPFLWTTILLSSTCYVAIGTIVVSIVRRQTTISTVSILYLIVTSIITILAPVLPLFDVLRWLLFESYMHNLLYQIISEQTAWWVWLYQVALIGFAGLWTWLAVRTFLRRGTTLATSR